MLSTCSTQDSKCSESLNSKQLRGNKLVSKDLRTDLESNKENSKEKVNTLAEDIKFLEEKFNFKMARKLGSGGFSDVYLGSQGGKQFAVKVVYIEPDQDELKLNKKVSWARNERIVTMNLMNKNCIKCLNFFESKSTQVLFLELAHKGDLANLTSMFYEKKLFKINLDQKCEWMNFMSESFIRFYLTQVLQALDYLKNMNLLHNDIKLENLLLTSRNQVKLSDFALSSGVPSTGRIEVSSAGTLIYMPPESLDKNNKFVDAKHALKIDYYAVGVILYRMLFGEFILNNSHKKENSKNLNKNLYLEELTERLDFITDANNNYLSEKRNLLSRDAKDLLRRLLKPNNEERANLEEIKSHPWMNVNQDNIKTVADLYEGDYSKFLIELQKLDNKENNKIVSTYEKGKINESKEQIKENIHHLQINTEKNSNIKITKINLKKQSRVKIFKSKLNK
jgi:serine/threonine protein kinase